MEPKPARLAVAAALAGALAASSLLPLGPFGSGLLVAFALVAGGVALVPGAWPALYRAPWSRRRCSTGTASATGRPPTGTCTSNRGSRS